MTSEQTHDPSESMSGTRRHLIRTAAGGFALAASGLVLPDWLEEAEAREGAHGGALGGRRGKNRRGRDKHKERDHGEKKDKHQDQDKPRGGGSLDFRGVAISVHNYRSVPVHVRGWRYDNKRGEFLVPTGWEATIPGRGADGSHSVKDFKTNMENVAVQIGTDRVVNCVNRATWWPYAAIGTGRWSERGWWTGGVVLANANLGVWESISADGIKVTRVPDTDDHILFSVDL